MERFLVGTLVTLVNGRNSLREQRAGIVLGHDPNGTYRCAVFSNGEQPQAQVAEMTLNVRVDDGRPVQGTEKWLIAAATGTGDVAGTVGALLGRIERMETERQVHELKQANALADVVAKLTAAIKTIGACDPALERCVEKALATSTIQRLNPISSGVEAPAEPEPVGAGASARSRR